MEGLAQLVSESMARHGVDCSLDYRRLHWSRWFPCQGTSDLNLVPSLPGILAIAEEVIAPGETAIAAGKRMLAVLEVNMADDLSIAMGRLFSPASALKERIANGRVFARYTVIEDDAQRESAHASFQRWLSQSTEAATGIAKDPAIQSAAGPGGSDDSIRSDSTTNALRSEVKDPTPIPAGF